MMEIILAVVACLAISALAEPVGMYEGYGIGYGMGYGMSPGYNMMAGMYGCPYMGMYSELGYMGAYGGYGMMEHAMMGKGYGTY